MSPLIQPNDAIHLTYKDINGKKCKYKYKCGKSLIFGRDFWHSTEVGKSSSKSVLLCLEFGTDKMQFCDSILDTLGQQGSFYRLPNGTFTNKAFD